MSERKIPIIDRNGEVVGFDDGHVIADGYGVRSSLFLLDSVQQSIAAANSRTRITDAYGNEPGSRPGFVYDASDNEAAARAAYDAHKKFLADSWRTPTVAADQTSQEKRRKLDDPEAAYEARKARLSNAWRTTRGVGFGPGSCGGE